ncbi:mitochondrial import inner membrane translocase subunit tim9 [Aulographum hederae CBS 113979]|uniref:Mitochondrial import inner membrane translocase subunit n=1 Tax=Aulographum hederae CBS 113979 TaxID=1176131 RepID=A0A6G1HA07_9PEZI|nr:mitochondrial import inner membrane translocase subunit tim9 [Aulographum hederae CBS 113979]
MEALNPSEQRELQARMERKTMKDFLTTYSNIVQRCFEDCISDFSSKSLTSREEGCLMRCVDKQLKTGERLAQRFQEENANQMAKAGQGGFPGR